MDKRKSIRKVFIIAFIVYAAFAVSYYFLSGDQLRYREARDNIDILEADSVTPEITRGVTASQDFVNTVDNIEEIALVFTK